MSDQRANFLVAPGAGFEPATNRLTAGCSTTELPGNSRCYGMRPITKPDRFAKHRIRAVSNRKNGGHGRNRTGVHGFAVFLHPLFPLAYSAACRVFVASA